MNATRNKEVYITELYVHYITVYNFLLRTSGNAAIAKDLTQDTFERAFKHIDKFEIGSNGKAWLFKIAFNLYINQYRKAKSRGETTLVDRVSRKAVATTSAMSSFTEVRIENALDAEFSDEVHKAMFLIPDIQRAIILMADLFDIPLKVIADEFDMNLSTVKANHRRGRLSIIEMLKGFAEDNYRIVSRRNS